MQPGQIVLVSTNPATQFVDAIAQNALATEVLLPPQGNQVQGPGFVDGALAAGGSCRGILRSIVVLSVQSIAWELSLWGDAGFDDPAPDLVNFFGKYAFAAADGVQYGGSGLYHYFVGGLEIPNVNLDDRDLGRLYLGLCPRTAGGKAGGAGGSVKVQLAFQPTMGW